jgi:N-acetylneuraminic acid mutarotase
MENASRHLSNLQKYLHFIARGRGGFVFGLCVLFAAATAAWPQETAPATNGAASPFVTFEARGAGTGEFQGTAAVAINAAGEIAGVFIDANGLLHGFVRAANGTITPFEAKDAGTGASQGTVPTSINASGVIAGTYIDNNLVSHGFVRASDGVITEFDAPGAGTAANRGTAAMSINDAGTIAGFYTTGSYLTNSTYHGFVRALDGTITTVDAPNAGSGEGVNSSKQGTSVFAINASGALAGSYKDSNSVEHGFVRSAGGTFAEFDAPDVGTCVASHGQNFGGTGVSSIDAAGDVAGYYTDTDCAQHGYVRSANGTIATFNAPGSQTTPCATSGFGKMFCGTLSLGIDTAGAIAGGYADPDAVLHGYVRSAGGEFTRLDAPGAATSGSIAGTAAIAINDAGTIAGAFVDAHSVLNGFVFTPALIATSTTLAASPRAPLYEEPVTLTAKVASSGGAPPNGEDVTFLVGKTTLATKALSGGTATLTTTALPVGADSITAVYGGDLSLAGSTSNVVSLAVGKAKSITKLVSSKNPSKFWEDVAFAATVSGQFGGTATGKVTFVAAYPPTTLLMELGTATLKGGVATLTTSSPSIAGSITAEYGGDAHFDSSTSAVVKQVVEKAATTTTLASSVNPSVLDQSVTFTATAKGEFGGTPSGTVTFSDGKTVLKAVTLSGGVAKLTTKALPVGTDSITAVYGGDAMFTGSTSNTVKQVVTAELTNAWTWMGGSSRLPITGGGPYGVYGTLGTPAAGNIPGGRYGAGSWTDSGGNLWLFGGEGWGASENYGQLNDLWEFNPSTSKWTWTGGSSMMSCETPPCLQSGTYGTLRTPAAGNIPGSRQEGSSWTDSKGHLWLFGGFGYGASGGQGWLNDLWEFNPATNEWAWISGSKIINASGTYGTLGTPAAANVPGGRYDAMSWTDHAGHFWIFGGNGWDANGRGGYLNDLWEFNPSTNEWTWMGGSSTLGDTYGRPGLYGTFELPAAGNVPGGRWFGVTWTDSSGNLWLFGGLGYDANDLLGSLNDVWEFNPSTSKWAWMGGSRTLSPMLDEYFGQPGVYGTLGTPAAGNIPGGRKNATSWTDSKGHLWLFGGFGYDSNGNRSYLNDLWELYPSTNQWAWMGGGKVVGQSGVYGELEVPAAGNVPGGREWASNWADSSGNLWLFGGWGNAAKGSSGYLNDLWRYQPSPIAESTPAAGAGGMPLSTEVDPLSALPPHH